jgi:predicted transcriptional regulator
VSETRRRIREQVADRPGVHFNELVRALDLAPGQVQYHLRRLCAADTVREESLYGRTHYYTPEYDEWERTALAVLRRETARDVLVTLVADGPSRPAEVVDALDIARSTLEYHLDRLVEQGLVEKERDSNNHVTLRVANPEATVAVLRLVKPTLPERLVDRFTRLVDDLLARR